MRKSSLSRDKWIAAGFQSLAQSGPSALQINLLAKRVGATKGSFYWHFVDLAEFKKAMLSLWHSKVATEIIEEILKEKDVVKRLSLLFDHAVQAAPDQFGGRKIESAMRAWSLLDDEVASVLDAVDEQRIGFLRTLLRDLGQDSETLAQLCYAAYIGLDDLAARDRAEIRAGFDLLQSWILDQGAAVETG